MGNIIVEKFMKSCSSIVCQKREASSTTSTKPQISTYTDDQNCKKKSVNPEPPEFQLRSRQIYLCCLKMKFSNSNKYIVNCQMK